MGAIMSIGVASANSILLVTFAREHREAAGCSARGGDHRRTDPTTPGADDGQRDVRRHAADVARARRGQRRNAALARAVLGGIAVGTCSTLLFVPFLYAVLRRGEVRPLEDYV